MKVDKLSINDVIDLAEYLEKDVYAERNEAFKEDEMLYELEFKNLLNIPDQFERDALVLSTGRDMVDTFCNHTNIAHASVKAAKNSMKTDIQSNAERHYGAGVIYMTNKDAEVSPWWDCAKNYWKHGMGVLKQIYISSDDNVFPIKIIDTHPFNVYPDPDPRSTDFIIEINYYNWIKAKTRYPFWDNPEMRNPSNPNVRHVSFWSATQHMELIDTEPVIRTRNKIDKHGYGVIPYVIFNSGLGSTTHDANMAKRYVGLLRYVKDLLIAESSVFSVNHVVLKKAGWPGGMLKGENAGSVQIQEGYGVWPVLPEGVEVVEYQHKVSPAEIVNEFAMLHSLLSEHGAPRSMQGMGEEGVRSGSDRRLLLAEGTTRLGQSIQTFRDRTGKVLENCAEIFVNKCPDDVRVWSRDAISVDTIIKKKDMKPPFDYVVEFSPVSPEDEYRRHDDDIRQLQAGLTTPRVIWENRPNVDADVMEEQVEWFKLMNSPAIEQMVQGALAEMTKAALAKKMGSDELLNQMEMEQNAQMSVKQKGPQGGMTQGIYERAMPGSPEDLENQRRMMNGPNPMNFGQGAGGGGERGVNR